MYSSRVNYFYVQRKEVENLQFHLTRIPRAAYLHVRKRRMGFHNIFEVGVMNIFWLYQHFNIKKSTKTPKNYGSYDAIY